MTVEKEELKAAGVVETGHMVQAVIGTAKHQIVLEHGKIAELHDIGTWFDGYMLQLNVDLEAGKIDDAEIKIAKKHLTKVGEQLTQRAGRSNLEIRHCEGEVRCGQRLAGSIQKRLELAEAKILKRNEEAAETEERRASTEAEAEPDTTPEGATDGSN